MPSGANRLEATDLSHAFGAVTALDGVSIAVEPGELVGVIGPNGSGKTTLLRAVLGLLDCDAGSVHRPDNPAGRSIGYVPQRPSFRPGFSTRETLDFYARLVDRPQTEPDRLLERVGLSDARDTRVEALSGGMTRLLGIAQAFVGDPPVAVLDEPSTGLDPGMRRHIFEVITEFVADDRGVLLASHDLELVERHATTVVLLDEGAVVAEGSPDDLESAFDVDSLESVYEIAVDRPEAGVTVKRGESP